MAAGGASLRCLATRPAAVRGTVRERLCSQRNGGPGGRRWGRLHSAGAEGSANSCVGSCWLKPCCCSSVERYAPSRTAWIE